MAAVARLSQYVLVDASVGEPVEDRPVEAAVRLRPFRESDVDLLVRFATDPAASERFEWFGIRSPEGYRRRWQADGFLERDPKLLAVVDADDRPLGWVSWRHGALGAQEWVWEIGAFLFPEHRGRGAGAAAYRLLVDHLFATTAAHRLSAWTEMDNLAEQRALETCGFVREGLARQTAFRSGRWFDSFIYGLLRQDL